MKQFIGGLAAGLSALAVYAAYVHLSGSSAPQAADVAPDLSPAAVAQQAEFDDWSQAKASRDPAQVAAYVSRYPNGPFTDDAMAFLNALLVPQGEAAQSEVTRGLATPLTPAGALEIVDAPAAEAPKPFDWTDAENLASGFSARDVEAVMSLTALYPPLDGLPESAWKDKTCAECHSLSVEELCQQSTTYTNASYVIEESSPHPLGVSFKKMLKGWANRGCP